MGGSGRRLAAGLLALAIGVGASAGAAPAGADEATPSVGAGEGGAPGTRAVTKATLTRNFGEIVVDEVGGHVFVTELDSVGVYDLDGERVGVIEDQFGASDLVLRGRTLYVVAPLVSRINRVDADTLAVTGGWAVTATPNPLQATWGGGRLWYVYGGQDAAIASLDPATGVVVPAVAEPIGNADLAATDTRLYVLDRGFSPSKISSFDITTTPITHLATSAHDSGSCGNGREIALAPDGATAWTACGAPYSFKEWVTATLAVPAVTYPAAAYPNGIAVDAGGEYLLGSIQSDQQLRLYEVDSPPTIGVFDLPDEVSVGMVALTEGAGRLYAGLEDGRLATIVQAPAVDTYTPQVVTRGEETAIAVTGSGFTDIELVTLGGRTLTPAIADDGHLTVTVPADLPAGDHPLVLTSRWGTNDTTPVDISVIDTSVVPFPTTAAFVDQQFRDLVGRPATAAEVARWVDAIDAGSKEPADLVAALRASYDNTTYVDPVVRLYQAAFVRTPDAAGLGYWTARRRGGTSIAAIAQHFAGSGELRAMYGTLTNRGFVQRVYQNVLGRPGDAAGIDYWTQQLDTRQRTRGTVLLGFSESPENKAAQVGRVHAAVLVVGMLGRAPTADEVAAIAAAVASGATAADLAAEILGSPEYAARVS